MKADQDTCTLPASVTPASKPGSPLEALGLPAVSLLKALSGSKTPLGFSAACRAALVKPTGAAARILDRLVLAGLVIKNEDQKFPTYHAASNEAVKEILSNYTYHASFAKKRAAHRAWTGKYEFLISLWHPTENGNRSPENVSISDKNDYTWQCDKGHVWQDSPNAISSNLRRLTSFVPCKVCRYVQFLSGYSDLFTMHPLIAKDFDEEKNDITVSEVAVYGPHILYWWKCPMGHSYDTTIANRVFLQSGCRYCAGQDVLLDFNDLKSQAGHLMASYDYHCNPDPSTVYYRSTKPLAWICEKGHQWYSSPLNRLEKMTKCTVCANKTLSMKDNSLAAKRPDLSLEWDYVGNYPLTPEEVIAGGTKIYSWLCPKHGSWRASMENRVYQNTGCNECTYGTVSKIQIALQENLKASLNENGNWRVLSKDFYRIPVTYGVYNRIDVDMVLENNLGQQVVIEYDGHRYHKTDEAFEKDLRKTTILLDAGYRVIRIREGELEFLMLQSANLQQLNYKYSLREEKVQKLTEVVINSLSL